MTPIINAQGLSKRYGPLPLFENISFTVSEGARVGLIGPNGSGKSTLLEILASRLDPDDGNLATRRLARVSCIAQISAFAPGDTIQSVIESALKRTAASDAAQSSRMAEILGRSGFTKFEIPTAELSGGWRKRLAITEALVEDPDVLLLDEPTNHLDLAGIRWLETLLQNAAFACVVVSHDRYFLENVATEIVELNRMYVDGILRTKGNYSQFLERKEEHLRAQGKRQDSLANLVHTEMEWLRRGPKARAIKAKARIDNAHELIAELADLKTRSRRSAARVDFSATGRETKDLIGLAGVAYAVGGRKLFGGIDFTVKAGMRVGLAGPNGSGKTTLLRLLRGDIEPTEGEIRRADRLRIVYFDQSRALDPELTLRRALAPDSDSVIYQDHVIHVASWAARFLFAGEDLNQPVGKLSGGERARVLIAQLMLQPADVLLLDEPTNDLDIPTLEILEESLLEYRGALVLVTHDRFMLDRISTVVLGFDGRGGMGRFANYLQWDAWQASRQAKETVSAKEAADAATDDRRLSTPGGSGSGVVVKKKLSYIEAREFAAIEGNIAAAERELHAKRAALDDPSIASDGNRLQSICAELAEVEKNVDKLYARWAELEQKQS